MLAGLPPLRVGGGRGGSSRPGRRGEKVVHTLPFPLPAKLILASCGDASAPSCRPDDPFSSGNRAPAYSSESPLLPRSSRRSSGGGHEDETKEDAAAAPTEPWAPVGREASHHDQERGDPRGQSHPPEPGDRRVKASSAGPRCLEKRPRAPARCPQRVTRKAEPQGRSHKVTNPALGE